jgi:putative chitinase
MIPLVAEIKAALGIGEVSAAAPPAAPLVTPDQLQHLGWVQPDVWALVLDHACRGNEITTRQRLAMFLANAGHETNGGRRLVESLDYSTAGAGQTFGKRATAEALACCRQDGRVADQRGLANIVYGGEWGAHNLGNTMPGDGWTWRGRGLLQVTGRAGYTKLAKLLGVTPEALAVMMQAPPGAADTAAAWWRLAGCNEIADAGDVAHCRNVVNGGTVGLDDVTARYKLARGVLGAA